MFRVRPRCFGGWRLKVRRTLSIYWEVGSVWFWLIIVGLEMTSAE